MEHKEIELELKSTGDDGHVTGYGSVFSNEDLGGDIVERGAFTESLKKEMPLMLWGHDFHAPPIGKWTEAKEDDHGLLLKGQLFTNASEHIHQIHTGLKGGAITGLSIGFYPIDPKWDDEREVRRIVKASLKEVSFVNFPMNEEARVESVKALNRLRRGELPSKISVEKMLREAGFTREQAKGLLAKGYFGLGPREAISDDVEALAKSMKQFTQLIER